MILPLEENSEFKDHQIFFSFKKKQQCDTVKCGYKCVLSSRKSYKLAIF